MVDGIFQVGAEEVMSHFGAFWRIRCGAGQEEHMVTVSTETTCWEVRNV